MPFLGSQPAEAALTTGDLGDDIVTLAKIQSGTDGELITWDSSGNPAAVAVGTSGHYLKSQGSGNPPVFAAVASSGFTVGTEVATTSGTTADFTGIPSGTKQIIINLTGVSWSASNSSPTIILGDAGGFETSGYVGAGGQTASATSSSRTDSFGIADTNRVAAADTLHGSVILTLEDASNYVWICNAMVGIAGSSDCVMFSTGSKTLSAELTQVRVTTVSGDTFDAGAINVQYIG